MRRSSAAVHRRTVLGGLAAVLGAASLEQLIGTSPAAAAKTKLGSGQFTWQVDPPTGGVFTL